MKKVTLTLCSLLLATSLNTKSLIPDKFKDYKTNYKHRTSELKRDDGQLFLVHHYDLDGDGISDVSEYHLCKLVKERIIVSQYPGYYYFDLNGDKEYQKEEILIDTRMDDLNGNEKWLQRLIEF